MPSKVAEPIIKNPALVRERRAALVRAAVDVIHEKGYAASGVSEIAQAAGVSHGSVYNYVSAKSDLLYLICEDHLRGYRETVGQALSGLADPLDRLEALLEATVEAAILYRKHYVIMLRELHHIEKSKRSACMALAVRQRAICEEVVRAALGHPRVRIDDPLITANMIVYMPNFLASRGWDFKGRFSDDKVATETLALMRRALGLQRAGRARARARQQPPARGSVVELAAARSRRTRRS